MLSEMRSESCRLEISSSASSRWLTLGNLRYASASGAINDAHISDHLQLQGGALELLSEQLGNVSEKVRQEVRPAIVKIIEAIKAFLSVAPESLLSAALHALETVTSTMAAGEEYVLTSTVPPVIATIHHRKATSSAASVLLVLMFVAVSSLVRCL